MPLWKIILGISIAIISLVILFIGWALVDDNIPRLVYYDDIGEQRKPNKTEKKKIIKGLVMIAIAIIGVIILLFLTQ